MSATPERPPSVVRDFIPVHSCGGLVAAVGLLLAAGAGLVSTLPGVPTANMYPAWATWALRLAPLLALALLWAVVYETHYKVRTEATAIHFRRGPAGSTRVPWREVTDYFADCGRGLSEVAESGGSLVHPDSDPGAPFARYGPDYTLISRRGAFVFNDGLAEVGVLTAEITRHAPGEAPGRWEEASWVTCRRCGERVAVSLWPLPAGHVTRYCDRCQAPAALPEGEAQVAPCPCGGALSQEALACATCGEIMTESLAAPQDGFIAERRGVLHRPEVWPPRVPEPVLPEEQTGPPPLEGGEPAEPA